MKNYFLILFLFSCYSVFSQDTPTKSHYSISGDIINNDTEEPIEFAAVGLFRANDTSLVMGIVTDVAGHFVLETQDTGYFFLKISCVGCKIKEMRSVHLEKTALKLGTIKINMVTTLKEVEISDDRPAYQVFDDKKVYRVDKDPISSTGSTAEILQNIPSVVVNEDGTVKLRGGKVKILIDGKSSSLLGISRKEVLDFIPANMIESVEVINNPSSKYDASGEAGIINIVLKKPTGVGINGSFSVSAGTEDKYNAAAIINIRFRKIAFTVSDDLRTFDMIGITNKNRRTDQNGVVDYLNVTRDWKEHDLSNSIRGRLQYSLNSKNDFTASFISKYAKSQISNFTRYEKSSDLSREHLLKKYDRSSPDTSCDHSYDYSFGYQRKFNRKDEVFSVDYFYAQGDENTITDIWQQYYDPSTFLPFSAPPLKEYVKDFGKQRHSMIQADFVYPFSKSGKIEIGVKSTYRYTDLDYSFLKYNYSTSEYFIFPGYTNHYTQSEQVNAGYFSYRNKIKKFSYRGGLRAEQTIFNSELANNGKTTKKDYVDFFPSVHLLYKAKGNNHLSLSYTKRINRPGAKSQNPFYKFLDAVTIHTGNPNLTPEYTNSFEFSHTKTWKKTTLNYSFYYRYTSGTVQKYSYLDTTGIAFTTYANFSWDKDIGAEVFITSQISNWYRFNVGLNGYRSIINGNNIDNTFNSDSYNYNAKINNYFTFHKKWIIQWTGNYVAPITTPLNKVHAFYFSDLSVKRNFFQNKFTVSVRVNDLFDSRNQVIDIYNAIYNTYQDTKKHSRVLYISFTYRPGFSKSKDAKNQLDLDQENEQDNNDPESK